MDSCGAFGTEGEYVRRARTLLRRSQSEGIRLLQSDLPPTPVAPQTTHLSLARRKVWCSFDRLVAHGVRGRASLRAGPV